MNPDEIIEKLLLTIQNGLKPFNSSLPKLQREAYKDVNDILLTLDVGRGGDVKNSIGNLRKINTITRRLERALLSDSYQKSASEFLKTYTQVDRVSRQYFQAIVDDFTAPNVLKAIKEQSVEEVVFNLTGQGLKTEITNPVRNILKTNITSKTSLFDLQKELRELILDTDSGQGILTKNITGITTDSINQYAASYQSTVSEDLGIEWFRYTGSLVRESRSFCKALVQKRYFHKSEIPGFMDGKVGKRKVPIYSKTGLPFGMIRGTNEDNFHIRRGGHRCNHMMIATPEELVPKSIRDSVLKS